MTKKKCLNKKYRAMLCTNEPTDPPLLPAYKHPAIMAKNLQRLNAITQKLKTEQKHVTQQWTYVPTFPFHCEIPKTTIHKMP